MGGQQQALVIACVVTCFSLLAGLVRRGRWRASYAWTCYLFTVGATELLILAWPGVFWTWTFWTGKELLLAILKLAIGLELGMLVFVRFPGAHRAARAWAALALCLTALGIAFAPRTSSSLLAHIALEAHARLSHGSALLLIALGFLVLWYRVPVHRLHRAILRGLATYLLLFSGVLRTAFSLLSRSQVSWWDVVTGLDGFAYVSMLAYWTWEAWRIAPEDDERGSPALESRLAWRARLARE